jgi:transposase-like protein
MAQPKLTDEKKQEIVDEVARCGSIVAASVKLGINRATADYRYRVAVASGFLPSIEPFEKFKPTTNKDNLVEKLERQVTHLKNSLAEAVLYWGRARRAGVRQVAVRVDRQIHTPREA